MVKNIRSVRYYIQEAQKKKPKYQKSKYKYGYCLTGVIDKDIINPRDIKIGDIFFNQFIANKHIVDIKNLKDLVWFHVWKIDDDVIYFRHVMYLSKNKPSIKEYELDRESFYEIITELVDIKIDLRVKRYLVCPGYCGDRYISYDKLINLYKVKKKECVNANSIPDSYNDKKLKRLVKLEPRFDKNYKIKLEIFKHKMEISQ